MNNIKETDSHEEKGDKPGEERCVTILITAAKSYYINTVDYLLTDTSIRQTPL